MKHASFVLALFVFLILSGLANAQRCAVYDPHNLRISDNKSIVCKGDEVRLEFECPNQALRVAWSHNIGNTTSFGVYIKPKETTTYTCVVTTSFGCRWEKSKTVLVHGDVEFTAGPDITICKGDTATIVTTKIDGGISYPFAAWNNFKKINDTTFKAWPVESKTYILQAGNGGACTISDAVSVVVNKAPEVKLVTAYNPGLNLSLQAEVNPSQPEAHFAWNFGDGSGWEVTNEAKHQYSNPGVYEGVIYADFGVGCRIRVPIQVDAFDGAMQNIVTPNGDDLNETFAPVLTSFPVRLQVFSKEGGKVFDQENYDGSWGKAATAGTYFYTIQSQIGKVWKGWVEVVR